MIIAHLSDLHLGYRAYTRTSEAGINQREADVALASRRAFEAVAGMRPDLTVVAGDIFHSVRPSNGAIAEAFRAVSRLATALDGRPIVLIAGDRDTPRSTDTTSILDLFREIPGVAVAADRTERFAFPEIGAEVVAVPYPALRSEGVPARADGREGWKAVLVTHAAVRGMPHGEPQTDDGVASVSLESLRAGEWDYVALGHHPRFVEIAPGIVFSGSPERTVDIWEDVAFPRGFVVYDTAAAATTFHAVEGRAVVDLPAISGEGVSPDEISTLIETRLRDAGSSLDGAIVRLVVTDIPRRTVKELDRTLLREVRGRALHFLLDARPATTASPALRIRGVSLESQVEEFLVRSWTPSMDGVDRERLLRLGLDYLRRAGERTE